ncbi:flippase [Halobacteriales archaeon Cl-PHB]
MSDTETSDSSLFAVLSGGSLVMIGLLAEVGISFVAKVLIAQYLGQVRYGAVTVGITVMAILSTIVVLGMNTGIGRFLPRYEESAERRGVLVSGFVISIPASLLTGGLVITLAPYLARDIFQDPSVTPILWIFGAIIPLSTFVKLTMGVIQGNQDSFPKVYIRHLALPTVRFGGIAVAILLGLGAVGISLAYLASFVVATMLGLRYIVRHTTLLSLGEPSRAKYGDLLFFSAPLVISTTMTVVFTDIDLLMLGSLRTLGETGVYNVVYPLAHLLMIGLSGFSFLFMPALSTLHGEGDTERMTDVYQVVTKWIFIITLPAFLIQALFPTLTIKLTFGPEYAAGATTLTVLASGFFVHSLLGPNVETLTAIGRTKTIMWANVLTAFTNVLLNLVLIPSYGFLGAGIATTVSYVVLNAVYSITLYRSTEIHPFTAGLIRPGIVGVVSVLCAYLIATHVFSPTLPVVLVILFGFLLVYSLAVIRFGIGEAEISIVLDLEEQYGLDLGPIKRVAMLIR